MTRIAAPHEYQFDVRDRRRGRIRLSPTADASGDFVFDLPSAATRATLHASIENARSDVALEL